MLSMTLLLFIIVLHMNNVLQIWKVATCRVNMLLKDTGIYVVFDSFVLNKDSYMNSTSCLHCKNSRLLQNGSYCR